MLIDVVVCTKDGKTPKGLYNLPLANLIVETSKPLGWARKRAIEKVDTDWFAFIDDDVEIDEKWYQTLLPYTFNDEVGAVQGELRVKGLGEKWDKAINGTTEKKISYRADPESVGHTHNTLIRTPVVRDWVPSRKDLHFFEDYEITQHILSKGYKWVVVPTDSKHIWSWEKLRKNSYLANIWWKKVFQPSPGKILRRIYGFIKTAIRHGRRRGLRVFIYYTYFRFYCILGLIFG